MKDYLRHILPVFALLSGVNACKAPLPASGEPDTADDMYVVDTEEAMSDSSAPADVPAAPDSDIAQVADAVPEVDMLPIDSQILDSIDPTPSPPECGIDGPLPVAGEPCMTKGEIRCSNRSVKLTDITANAKLAFPSCVRPWALRCEPASDAGALHWVEYAAQVLTPPPVDNTCLAAKAWTCQVTAGGGAAFGPQICGAADICPASMSGKSMCMAGEVVACARLSDLANPQAALGYMSSQCEEVCQTTYHLFTSESCVMTSFACKNAETGSGIKMYPGTCIETNGVPHCAKSCEELGKQSY